MSEQGEKVILPDPSIKGGFSLEQFFLILRVYCSLPPFMLNSITNQQY